jgi:hypothetical protein
MFDTTEVAVLVLTMFLSNGMATSRVINAPSLEDCKAAKPAIVAELEKSIVKMGPEKLTVQYVDGQCIVARKGTKA